MVKVDLGKFSMHTTSLESQLASLLSFIFLWLIVSLTICKKVLLRNNRLVPTLLLDANRALSMIYYLPLS